MAGFLAALLSAGIMLTGCGSGPAASSGPEETAVENTTVSQGAAAEDTAAETTEEENTTAEAAKEEAPAEEAWNPYTDTKEAAVRALSDRLQVASEAVYVYKDFGLTENHFTQKAKMAGIDSSLVMDMDENWQENPWQGSSCIRCEQVTKTGDWGGWLFLNGYLPAGETVPSLNDGSVGGQGLDLTGADALRFYARGDQGGETVEFFTAGFGYDATTN